MNILGVGIYELEYSHLILPINLMENAKLNNYKYVKFYKDDMNLMVEMQCVCLDNIERVFTYIFDKKEFLQKIISNDGKIEEEIFNREVELRKAIKKHNAEYKNLKTKSVG